MSETKTAASGSAGTGAATGGVEQGAPAPVETVRATTPAIDHPADQQPREKKRKRLPDAGVDSGAAADDDRRHRYEPAEDDEPDEEEEEATTVVSRSSISAAASSSTVSVSSSGESLVLASALPSVAAVSRPAITSSTASSEDGDGEEAAAAATKLARMSEACRTILECIGEDPSRDGLAKTPERWAKALLFMTRGYAQTPYEVTNGAVFQENHDEMVVVRNIDVHSLCEHHMVPFVGKVHIGYIPRGRVLGLSKLARIAELFARRLQVQERLTRQIADAVVETVDPLGVAVVVECTHFCMVMRGVQKAGAVTTTSSVRGCFESNPKTRAEFFSILHGNGIRMC